MRSNGWALIQSDCCPHKKRRLGHRHAQREGHVKTGRRQPSTSHERPHKKSILPTPWCQISSLQNHEKIISCCLSHWACDSVLRQPEQTMQTEAMFVSIDWCVPSACHSAWHTVVLRWVLVDKWMRCLFNWIQLKEWGSRFCLSIWMYGSGPLKVLQTPQTPELYNEQVSKLGSRLGQWPKST